MRYLYWLSLAVLVLASCRTYSVLKSTTTVFGRTWPTVDESGRINPVITVDLGELQGGTRHAFELGNGRSLEVRDHVGFEREELVSVGETMRRCYAHLRASTGLEVGGDTLYFLLPLDPDGNSYTFEYEVPKEEAGRWAWGAAIAFRPGEGISRDGSYSLDLYEAMLLSTPHEITEGMVTRIDNLQCDQVGGESHHTRWFHDGVAEYVSSAFAKQEFPRLWAADRYQRGGLHEVMDDDRIREAVLDWDGTNPHQWTGPEDDGGPVDEYRKYPAAELLVTVWAEATPLPEILARIAAHDVPVDGEVLLAMVERDTGLDRDGLLAAARRSGRSEVPPGGR